MGRQMLYGKDAAAMYDQAAALQKSARETFYKASDAFFKANAAASYNDWKRARAHWDYVSPPVARPVVARACVPLLLPGACLNLCCTLVDFTITVAIATLLVAVCAVL